MNGMIRLVLALVAGVGCLAAATVLSARHGVSADWMDAFANLVMAAGTVTAAFWAVYSFRQAQRAEAARWVKDLFAEFFFNPIFDEVRDLVEFGYDARVKPLLQSVLLGRYLQQSSDEDRRILKELDNFLNYLEYVLYLEDMGRIDKQDREAVFNYWTSLLADDDHALIRLYCREYGYERVASLVNSKTQPKEQLLAVYGTLRKGQTVLGSIKFLETMQHYKTCLLKGKLLNLGEYPGLVDGTGTVKADIFKITDLRLWHELDQYEDFDPQNPEDSEYERVYCRLKEPKVDAWVYRYIGPTENVPEVKGGDWAARERVQS